jgi:hypothetical protein
MDVHANSAEWSEAGHGRRQKTYLCEGCAESQRTRRPQTAVRSMG